MMIIKKLSGMIEEEIADAKKYAQCALNYKKENKTLGDIFYSLSNEEMKHMGVLHAEAVKMIEQYKKEHGDPPEVMMELYDYLHERHMEAAAEVKGMLAMYQG